MTGYISIKIRIEPEYEPARCGKREKAMPAMGRGIQEDLALCRDATGLPPPAAAMAASIVPAATAVVSGNHGMISTEIARIRHFRESKNRHREKKHCRYPSFHLLLLSPKVSFHVRLRVVTHGFYHPPW